MLYEKKGRYIVEFPDIPKARQHQIEIGLEERANCYKEVELGFDEERARREAKRCLSCRRCLGCALCWAECKPEAIIFEMEDELIDLEADSVILSQGVERAIDRIDGRFGLGKHLNVITDLQFERMLSDSGPSAGLVIRPFDGEIPKSIAFVQAYQSAAPKMHHAALCYGINEAVIAARKLGGAEIQFFATDMETFRQEQKDVLGKLNGIKIHDASVSAIEAVEGENLKLTVTIGGSEQSFQAELVVLLTQPQLSKDIKALSKDLGLSLAYTNFLTGNAELISTDKDALKLMAQV